MLQIHACRTPRLANQSTIFCEHNIFRTCCHAQWCQRTRAEETDGGIPKPIRRRSNKRNVCERLVKESLGMRSTSPHCFH